jgi:prevent-host-death family protein
MVVARTVNSREVRRILRDLLDAANKGDTDTVIERNGRPVAALIPYEDYEALQEELDDLRAGRRAQAALEAWEKDRSLGRPYAEVRAEMIRDGLLDA